MKDLISILKESKLYLSERVVQDDVSVRVDIEARLVRLALNCYSSRNHPDYDVFREGVVDLIKQYSSHDRMVELLEEDDLIPFERVK